MRIEAKDLQSALTQAASELECSVLDVEYEIIQRPSSGFLGLFGKKNAIIEAHAKKRGYKAKQAHKKFDKFERKFDKTERESNFNKFDKHERDERAEKQGFEPRNEGFKNEKTWQHLKSGENVKEKAQENSKENLRENLKDSAEFKPKERAKVPEYKIISEPIFDSFHKESSENYTQPASTPHKPFNEPTNAPKKDFKERFDKREFSGGEFAGREHRDFKDKEFKEKEFKEKEFKEPYFHKERGEFKGAYKEREFKDREFKEKYREKERANARAHVDEIARDLKALIASSGFDIKVSEVSVWDTDSIYIKLDGEDAALLIGKEAYRYKALSYLLHNWINSKFNLLVRLEIAEFLKNQEQGMQFYLKNIIEKVESTGRAQTKHLDGVLIKIALEQLRERFPNKYVGIKQNGEQRFVVVNDFFKKDESI